MTYLREKRTTDLFLPPRKVAGDDPMRDPIERATYQDGNVRLTIRSRDSVKGAPVRTQVDWSVADVTRAIAMLHFIRHTLETDEAQAVAAQDALAMLEGQDS